MDPEYSGGLQTDFLSVHLVMGDIENLLSWLLKDKIPRYHGILLYSDFPIFTENFTKFIHAINE